jgi:regulator of replication initiation timing
MIAAQELALFRLEERIPTLLRSREAVEKAVDETSAVVDALKRHLENAKLRYKYDHKRGNKAAEKATKEYAAAQCALDGEQEALRTMRDTLAEEYLPSIHDKWETDSEGAASHAGVNHDQSAHGSDTGSDPALVTPTSPASRADSVTVLSPTQEAGISASAIAEQHLLEAALEKLPKALNAKRPRDEVEVEAEVS